MNCTFSREAAIELLHRHVKDPNMIKHCLASEAVMRALATRVGEDPVKWGMAGLLHDLDVESHNDLSVHTTETVRILNGLGIDTEIVDAIRLH
ncbi:MAG TPA: HDIG domain-containing protein, partial [Myxococcota bacterium]|nr:HDIG domain-containing protein [Myxococcota bacterium]